MSLDNLKKIWEWISNNPRWVLVAGVVIALGAVYFFRRWKILFEPGKGIKIPLTDSHLWFGRKPKEESPIEPSKTPGHPDYYQPRFPSEVYQDAVAGILRIFIKMTTLNPADELDMARFISGSTLVDHIREMIGQLAHRAELPAKFRSPLTVTLTRLVAKGELTSNEFSLIDQLLKDCEAKGKKTLMEPDRTALLARTEDVLKMLAGKFNQ